MSRRAFSLLRDGKLPKGDALALGEAAGIMAAKRTSDLVPLCHPLPLERVEISFELDARLPGARARCEAAAFAKTGVEMEALCGVWGALLAVYDVVKQVDPALVVEEVKLETKQGGKTGSWTHPEHRAFKSKAARTPRTRIGKAFVITVSDRCAAGKAKDVSGPLLAEGLRALGLSVAGSVIVPDERDAIAGAVERAARRGDVVTLIGGTGLSPRDVTPETVAALCDRMIPGIGEALRTAGRHPLSPLSRSAAGLRGRCLIVCLPGSPGAVRDGLAALEDLLPHAVHIARGGDHG